MIRRYKKDGSVDLSDALVVWHGGFVEIGGIDRMLVLHELAVMVRKLENITITLDDETARWARITADKRDTSVSKLLGEMLRADSL